MCKTIVGLQKDGSWRYDGLSLSNKPMNDSKFSINVAFGTLEGQIPNKVCTARSKEKENIFHLGVLTVQ